MESESKSQKSRAAATVAHPQSIVLAIGSLLVLSLGGIVLGGRLATSRIDFWFAPITYIAVFATLTTVLLTRKRGRNRRRTIPMASFAVGGVLAFTGAILQNQEWLLSLGVALATAAWVCWFGVTNRWSSIMALVGALLMTVPIPSFEGFSLLQSTARIVASSTGQVLDVVRVENLAYDEFVVVTTGVLSANLWWGQVFHARLVVALSLWISLNRDRSIGTAVLSLVLSLAWFWGIKVLFFGSLVVGLRMGVSVQAAPIEWSMAIVPVVIMVFIALMNDWFSQLFCVFNSTDRNR